MSGPTRDLFRILIRNFIDSLKPRPIFGNKMGQDYIGNTYFEIPARPEIGKRKPKRWYNTPEGKEGQDPVPEWESWLRLRRDEPPTEEEISHNLAIAEMKKVNAAKIEAQRLLEGGSLPTTPEKGLGSFPKYDDFGTGPSERK